MAVGVRCDEGRLRNNEPKFMVNDSRLNSRLEIAREPNSGVDTEPKLVDYPVPLMINVPEMYRMVSSKSIPTWTFHSVPNEVKVPRRGGFHWDSRMVRVPVEK